MRISDWSSDVCSSDLMRARGDLRYHAAIGPVLGFLPRDAVRADAPLAVDKRRRGFVAARFEAEDQSHDMALPYPRGACGSKQGLRIGIRAKNTEAPFSPRRHSGLDPGFR